LLQLGLLQQRVTETAAGAKVPFLASQQQGCGLHQQLWQQRGMTMMLWRDIVPFNGWYALIAKNCHVTVCNTDGMAVDIRRPCVTRQQCALAAPNVPASKLFFLNKITNINKKTTLNNIQFLDFSSGSWLQSRCQTYALRLRQTAHYGVGDGTYGCRWLSNLRPGPSLFMHDQLVGMFCPSTGFESSHACICIDLHKPAYGARSADMYVVLDDAAGCSHWLSCRPVLLNMSNVAVLLCATWHMHWGW
jgi:hypothetical protein